MILIKQFMIINVKQPVVLVFDLQRHIWNEEGFLQDLFRSHRMTLQFQTFTVLQRKYSSGKNAECTEKTNKQMNETYLGLFGVSVALRSASRILTNICTLMRSLMGSMQLSNVKIRYLTVKKTNLVITQDKQTNDFYASKAAGPTFCALKARFYRTRVFK